MGSGDIVFGAHFLHPPGKVCPSFERTIETIREYPRDPPAHTRAIRSSPSPLIRYSGLTFGAVYKDVLYKSV